jgi:dihydropteroate synthase
MHDALALFFLPHPSHAMHQFQLRGRLLDLSSPAVMGILNVTPDSFYAGSRVSEHDLLRKAEAMLEAGAALLDVGGYSTRPGAADVSEQEEQRRTATAIGLIAKHFPDALLSADTFRASVAQASADAGAHLINDISGGDLDPGMFETVGRLGLPYVLMHTRGTPQDMAGQTAYGNLLEDVLDHLRARLARLRECGVKDVAIDPGFGFAKTLEQNYWLLSRLPALQALGVPILAGVSRKSMIYKLLGTNPEEALNGTTALHVLALQQGARLLRVHDVREAVETVKIWRQFKEAEACPESPKGG